MADTELLIACLSADEIVPGSLGATSLLSVQHKDPNEVMPKLI